MSDSFGIQCAKLEFEIDTIPRDEIGKPTLFNGGPVAIIDRSPTGETQNVES